MGCRQRAAAVVAFYAASQRSKNCKDRWMDELVNSGIMEFDEQNDFMRPTHCCKQW